MAHESHTYSTKIHVLEKSVAMFSTGLFNNTFLTKNVNVNGLQAVSSGLLSPSGLFSSALSPSSAALSSSFIIKRIKSKLKLQVRKLPLRPSRSTSSIIKNPGINIYVRASSGPNTETLQLDWWISSRIFPVLLAHGGIQESLACGE